MTCRAPPTEGAQEGRCFLEAGVRADLINSKFMYRMAMYSDERLQSMHPPS